MRPLKLLGPLLLLGLGACRDADRPDSALTLSDDSGSPPEGQSSTPWYTAQELGEQVLALGEQGLPHARALRDTYQGLMDSGDEECPGSLTEIENELEGCTTESGWYYGGILTYQTEEITSEEGETQKRFWTDICDFQIVDPEGTALIGGGAFWSTWTRGVDGLLTVDSSVKGSWVYPESAYPWLTGGLSSDLAYRLTKTSDSSAQLYLWGTLGTPEINLYLEDLAFDYSCSNRVSSGTVWLRQGDGTWYEMVWRDDCSGCYDVLWDFHEDLGSACVDLSGLKERMVADLEVEP